MTGAGLIRLSHQSLKNCGLEPYDAFRRGLGTIVATPRLVEHFYWTLPLAELLNGAE